MATKSDKLHNFVMGAASVSGALQLAHGQNHARPLFDSWIDSGMRIFIFNRGIHAGTCANVLLASYLDAGLCRHDPSLDPNSDAFARHLRADDCSNI